MAFVGESTTTGNKLVAELPIGAVLEVTAQGELTVIDVPEPPAPEFNVGDLVDHLKYGTGQVSRMSIRLSNPGGFNSGSQVLVAFDDGVIRAVDPDTLDTTAVSW